MPGKLRKERKTAGKTAKIMHNTLQKIDKCLRLTYNIHKQVFDRNTIVRVVFMGKKILSMLLRSVYKELHADRETGC